MANTTNFGWETPDDDDLVKDGAAAMRTLGQAIDTSMVDLKGGTTGQVLSKASNTDLDYAWINNDQGDITAVNTTAPLQGGGTTGSLTLSVDAGTTSTAGVLQLTDSISSTSTTTAATPNSVKSAYDLANAAIAKSIVDAKGDIIAATGADTVSRLAVGANNTVLTADSSTATGLKWATPSSGLNWTLLNAGGTALTGASSVTVTGISNKSNLMIIINNGSSSNASANVKIRINGDSGNNYNAWGNQTVGASTYATGNLSGFSSTGGNGIQLCDLSSAAASSCVGYVRLDGCTSGDLVGFWGVGGVFQSTGNNQYNYNFGGYYDSSASVSEITVLVSTGNWDAGTLYVYGA